MKIKSFTLVQANDLIPELEGLLARVEKKRTRCERLHDTFFVRELVVEVLPEDKELRILDEDARRLDDLVQELEEDIALLRRTGCRIRNLERGCIDFLGEHAGEEIYFCWVRGEKNIRFYHSIEDPSIRHPLS